MKFYYYSWPAHIIIHFINSHVKLVTYIDRVPKIRELNISCPETSDSVHRNIFNPFNVRKSKDHFYKVNYYVLHSTIIIKLQYSVKCLIPLRAKRVGEFIEIRHKNISPTRILGTLGRDSVTL